MEKEKTIPIIYEDADMLVIDKPAGSMVHGDGRSDEKTIADWFLERYPDARDVGEPYHATKEGAEEAIHRTGIVHRLDKETSGVLVLAKSQDAFLRLKAQFQKRHAKKEYRAFVYGVLKRDRMVIDRPIGRSKKDFRLFVCGRGVGEDAREAQTTLRVLKCGREATYLSVLPKTGRTHQIRVHLKSIGYPVVADALYAPNNASILGFARLALHAHTLSLRCPDGVVRTFTAPLPSDFLAASACIEKEE